MYAVAQKYLKMKYDLKTDSKYDVRACMIILLFYHIVQIAVLKSILGHIECTQCIICDLLLLMSHAVWSVCLSVC